VVLKSCRGRCGCLRRDQRRHAPICSAVFAASSSRSAERPPARTPARGGLQHRPLTPPGSDHGPETSRVPAQALDDCARAAIQKRLTRWSTGISVANMCRLGCASPFPSASPLTGQRSQTTARRVQHHRGCDRHGVRPSPAGRRRWPSTSAPKCCRWISLRWATSAIAPLEPDPQPVRTVTASRRSRPSGSPCVRW